ncbi:copper-sensing transcriptional repressor CsoR [Gottschalkia acidurici 9a]|uniref:Copper-sensing transcriptional repressor CsoR n=1 Tax=Gottschalkia acidurici (strain ATCC 7906 / DSM 604 / BCRC 14475 / CIP 104303 / KCTC 5404 / NCIMB 10678 / 9a) TaxID=1128398 RepID=K0AVB8_GOTA9|nr:metal-sensing transcriptional repressor [Gottschalkia acidurici]AFS77219.1 copper-sensing transcriptional repressor CsoR [Gottschalkia acidurici 9a]
MNEEKKKAVTLLKTSKGQIEAVIKMIEDDRYCVDIANQILAAKGLLEKANLKILEQHIKSCVKDAIVKGEGDEKIDEILSILDKYFK